jgi:molecular chaperone GrpE (heat shock protein)
VPQHRVEFVKGFDAGLRLWKKEGGVDVAFTTDLDEQFGRGITTALGAELTKLQNEIRAKVEAAVAAMRQEFEALYARKRDEVQKQLESYQGMINEKTALLENTRKDLQARLEKQKKGALDNLLKGVLKK